MNKQTEGYSHIILDISSMFIIILGNSFHIKLVRFDRSQTRKQNFIDSLSEQKNKRKPSIHKIQL